MRAAGRVVAQVLQEMHSLARPGITTAVLDKEAEKIIRKAGAAPTFLGYHGFPASICVSFNDAVVHGIPGLRRLQDGDLVSIEVGATLEGYVGDAAVTIPVGSVSKEAQRLVDVTRESLMRGIAMACEGNKLSDISHAIQSYVESNGFSVVRKYVGHGVGSSMHEDPQIPNFGPPGRGPKLVKGMTLAIEPMVNAGGHDVKLQGDNWTVVTKDGSLSAHFEHSIAITEEGPLILTQL